MRAAVGVTDNQWAAYLRDRPHLVEANFWLPSGMRFGALRPGEPFLFKTHWPDNKIVGGGFYQGYVRLKVSEAWAYFGEGNGVASAGALLTAINRYRRDRRQAADDVDPMIGCILLRNLFFASPGAEFDGPPDFGKPIVTWKRYDLEEPNSDYVAHVFEQLQRQPRVDATWDVDLTLEGGEIQWVQRLRNERLGQGGFKSVVLASYERHCAITGTKITPVLEAAHIRPATKGGTHRVTNGLLLRSDVHKLFDDGYLGIDDKHRLHVSPRLREDFGNGREFYAHQGNVIHLPTKRTERPDREAVTWHMDEVFKRA